MQSYSVWHRNPQIIIYVSEHLKLLNSLQINERRQPQPSLLLFSPLTPTIPFFLHFPAISQPEISPPAISPPATTSMPLCPSPCISFTAYQNWVYNRTFLSFNLRPKILHLQRNQSTLICWTPRHPDPNSRPSLLLLHGFGANCTWQWSSYLNPLVRSGFDLYIPNLLFFGESHTARSDRSEAFQAECVMEAMAAMGVDRIRAVVGVSYGGFVGHRIAAMFGEKVERVVLVSAGVCLEEEDLKGGMFAVGDLEEAASILVPQTPDRLRRLVRLSHYRTPVALPTCFLWDYIHVSLLNSDSEVLEDV